MLRLVDGSPSPDSRDDILALCEVVHATGESLTLPDRGEAVVPRAFMGVPVGRSFEKAYGVLCVIEAADRLWSDGERALLADLAGTMADQLDLADRLVTRDEAESRRLAEMIDITHELRSPLQTIVGFTEFLKTETRRHLITAHARTIQTAAESVLCIINQTLDAAGAPVLARSQAETVDLRDFAEMCLSMVGPTAVAKQLQSRLVIHRDVPPTITLDRQKVFQALLNLLNNAVKFTDRGSFTLEVSRTGGGLRFAVADTGIGIAPDQRDKLFQRFSRITSDTHGTDGTGLGLAITKGLVEGMGGTIGVVPNADGGTIFWFEVVGGMADEAAPAIAAPPTGDMFRAARILLADDLDLNRKLIADMLAIDGHDVDCVADGAAAVEAATRTVYDLILMDMIMPEMDGIAACRAIRALAAPAGRVPIIALTANNGRDQLDSCLEAGMNATLVKPMTFEGLTTAVAAWVGRRKDAA